MNRDRTTRCLLFSTALLLAANFVMMLVKNPSPAFAQDGGNAHKYEVVSSSLETLADIVNSRIAAGWHVKSYCVTEQPTGSRHHILLEK